MVLGGDHLLSWVVFVPLGGALVILSALRRPAAARVTALVVALGDFVLSLAVYGRFDPARGDDQLVERAVWLAQGKISYALGVDGISLFLVLLTTLLGVVVVLGVIVTASLLSRAKPKGEEVYMAKAEKRDVISVVTASGRVQPRKKVNVQSQVMGEIVKLPVKEGDPVRSGDLLAQLDAKKRGAGNIDICKAARIWQRDLQEPFIRTMQALGEEGAEKALAQLAEVEYQSKTGIGDAAENIERFLLSLTLK